MAHITANDGTRLFYEEVGHGRPLVMLHGWTFSSRVFADVAARLAPHARVVMPDLRGHGRSDKPGYGYGIARLSADLRDLITALEMTEATLLGWSLGCPIIWSYLELFGPARVRDTVLVEQSPCQFRHPNWRGAHAQSFDQASNAVMLAQMEADPAAFDRQNLASCTRRPMDDAERDRLLVEMALAPVEARAAVMNDHTVRDWRPLLPRLDVPALVMVAEKDGVFPDGGPEWAGEAMPRARTVRFAESGHMIFRDEPDRFVATVRDFISEDVA